MVGGGKGISARRSGAGRSVLIKLNQEKFPGCYIHRSNPNDVARVEQCTFICTDEGGSRADQQLGRPRRHTEVARHADGAMRGRTMYVVPYLMGPPGSPLAKVGIELTDSIYVVLSMRIMTRMGALACEHLGKQWTTISIAACTACWTSIRSAASSRISRRTTRSSRSAPTTAAMCCWARNVSRCASAPISREGGLDRRAHVDPRRRIAGGREDLRRGRFPQRLRQDEFRHDHPARAFQGLENLDDRRRHRVDEARPDGRLYAINPEAGYFGVVPGTNYKSNPNAMRSISRDTIYTNVALTPDGDVWWEGKDGDPPKEASIGAATGGRPTRRKKRRIRTAASPRRCPTTRCSRPR